MWFHKTYSFLFDFRFISARERRTRRVRDSKGRYTTKTEYVTVVTWRGSKTYNIPYWRDASQPTPHFTPTCYTKLTLPDLVHFENAESREHFRADQQAFINENRHRDRKIRFHTKTTIPGLTKRHMVCGRDYVPPWWMTLGYYWLATILHLTWPYRWKLNAMSDSARCQIVKVISCRPPETTAPCSPPYPAFPDTDHLAGNHPPPGAPPFHPSAPSFNAMGSQQQSPIYGMYSIHPDLIMSTGGDDDAPPTYEEVMGTGGHEYADHHGAGSGTETGGRWRAPNSEAGLHTFSNEEYHVESYSYSYSHSTTMT